MRILFLILAHHEPKQLAELAGTLISAASDARVMIHFDGNARPDDFRAIEDAVRQSDRIHLVRNRVACKWGDYSLVQGVVNGLSEARALGHDYDYVVLLSGSCLPCRPVRQLERYLAERQGTEFIEAHDESWMVGGLRRERYELYYPFPAFPGSTGFGSWRENVMISLQRHLKIRRKVPAGLEVRFGSQWWGLTRRTCERLLDFLAENPSVELFFRKSYIPDEMVFPTIVNHLVAENIAGFGLTFFQFTDYGKPTVFYDDHGDYPFTLDKFFFRKVSSEAVNLRRKALAVAHGSDDGKDLAAIGRPNHDYGVKVTSQVNFPAPGQIYYRDQFCDMNEHVLRTVKRPYVVACGLPDRVEAFLSRLEPDVFETFGRLYKADEIDFGGGRTVFGGIRSGDFRLRDMHPFLFLARIIRRTPKIPAFAWMPGDDRRFIDAAVLDSHALVVSLPPMGGNTEESRNRWVETRQPPRRQLLGIQEKRDIAIQQTQKAAYLNDQLLAGIGSGFNERVLIYPQPRGATPAELQTCTDIYAQSRAGLAWRFSDWFPHVDEALSDLSLQRRPVRSKTGGDL